LELAGTALFLIFFLVLSFIAWRYRKSLFKTYIDKEKYHLALSLILTVATFIFFSSMRQLYQILIHLVD